MGSTLPARLRTSLWLPLKSAIATVLLPGVITGYVPWRYLGQEPTLRRLFGDECRNYCRRVGRWIPCWTGTR
jgi:protein-S-isoprenylcysteine O-methyltransferase Ste14